MLTYILFVFGFVALIKGSDMLVDGASAIARRLNVSDLVIGLTIVSIGTSSPELFVNLIAAAKGTTDLAIGVVIGSNIANIFLILGLTALINPIKISNETIWRGVPFSALAAIMLAVLANDLFLGNVGASTLTPTDGVILLFFFCIFLYYLFRMSNHKEGKSDSLEIPTMGILKSSIYIIIGLLGLSYGSDWIVQGAVKIAQILGISEKTIGLTIIAFGTSLPELAASIVAAAKNKVDLAVGNIIGSNVFNVFLVLGLTSIIQPLPFNNSMNIDIAVMLAANIFILVFMFIGRKKILDRWEGGLMFLVYLMYIGYLYIYNV